jgi:hypothetical protein
LLDDQALIKTRPGSWGAGWTLGVKGKWPDNGECDVYEFYEGDLLLNVAWCKQGNMDFDHFSKQLHGESRINLQKYQGADFYFFGRGFRKTFLI